MLPRVQWHMDEPSADPSAVALYFVDQEAAKRVKAVLSGEGADEFFGGYRIYQVPFANRKLSWAPKGMLRGASKALRAWAFAVRTIWSAPPRRRRTGTTRTRTESPSPWRNAPAC